MKKTNESSFDVLGRISELLTLHDMSFYKLSKLSGISQSTISTWYKKNYYPPIDKLEIICQVFDISLEDFFYESEKAIDEISLEDKEFLKIYHRLSSYHKKVVYALAANLAEDPDHKE